MNGPTKDHVNYSTWSTDIALQGQTPKFRNGVAQIYLICKIKLKFYFLHYVNKAWNRICNNNIFINGPFVPKKLIFKYHIGTDHFPLKNMIII